MSSITKTADGRREPIERISRVPRTVGTNRGTTWSSYPSALVGRYERLSQLTKVDLAASRRAR